MTDRAEAIGTWYRGQRPEVDDVRVAVTDQLSQGYSNEVVVAQVEAAIAGVHSVESIVVRLPPTGPPLFPDHDLDAQVAAQDVAHDGGVPVPRPLVVEPDPSWLGAPFLVMPLVQGRHPGEVPALTGWLREATEAEQRQVQTGLLDALAALHRSAWRGTAVDGVVRHPSTPRDDVAWWSDYAAWACEGHPPGPLADMFAWCRDQAPAETAAPALLWGDVRLGNVVVDDSWAPAALLDWEMTTIGPVESDVAWYTALSRMTDHFVGASLPGFLDREGVVAHVEAALSRPLRDFDWHECFAVARAAAASFRTSVVKALAEAQPIPDPASDHVVRYATSLVLR